MSEFSLKEEVKNSEEQVEDSSVGLKNSKKLLNQSRENLSSKMTGGEELSIQC